VLEYSKKDSQILIVWLLCVSTCGKSWIGLTRFTCWGIIHIRAQAKPVCG